MPDRNELLLKEISDVIDGLAISYNKSLSLKTRLLKDIRSTIIKRTRKGFGVDFLGNLYKLPPLSEAYIKQRLRAKNLARGKTSASKSNLTATGLMLDSLDIDVKNSAVFLKNKKGKTLNGKNSKVSNDQKLEFQEDQERRFLDLSNSEVKKFADKVTSDVIRLLDSQIKNIKV